MNRILRNVTLVDSATRHDLGLRDDRVSFLAPAGAERGSAVGSDVEVIDCGGATVIPGLHDHHIHLLAAAEARRSVACGPPTVETCADLARSLAAARPRADGWIRGVGYHESVAGPLDRLALDGLRADDPVRIQHATGGAWFVNTTGWERLGRPPGDGVLHRRDDELRALWGGEARIDLAPLGRTLAGHGICGVTDATAHNGPGERAIIDSAVSTGQLPITVTLMGGDRLGSGHRKIVLGDHDLPPFDELVATIDHAREQGRAVAIHSVTRTSLALAVAALRERGADRRDRIEHASVAPPDLTQQLAQLGVTVVTQPGFVAERGDRYRSAVDPDDLRWLHRCRGFVDAGVPLAAGTDAPYGDTNPWRAIRAAIDRRTTAGVVLGPAETLTPDRALDLFLGPAEDPGGPPRRLSGGAPADVCVLRGDWRRLRADLPPDPVALTISRGVVTHR